MREAFSHIVGHFLAEGSSHQAFLPHGARRFERWQLDSSSSRPDSHLVSSIHAWAKYPVVLEPPLPPHFKRSDAKLYRCAFCLGILRMDSSLLACGMEDKVCVGALGHLIHGEGISVFQGSREDGLDFWLARNVTSGFISHGRGSWWTTLRFQSPLPGPVGR